MGFNNPGISWRELERTLSDRRQHPDAARFGSGANGSDSPAWTYRRPQFEAPAIDRTRSSTPYAELHCRSAFSFLDGSCHPESLAAEAARLGLEALAITDLNGFYGVVRFAEAARAVGLPTVFGAELVIGGPKKPPVGEPMLLGDSLVVIGRDPVGYAALGRLISEAQLAGTKGAPQLHLGDFERWLGTGEVDHLAVLTGAHNGAVPKALAAQGPAAAAVELDRLVERFGRANVFVELWDWGEPLDSARNDALVRLALQAGVESVAVGACHYATPGDRKLATALQAVGARRSLDEMNQWLAAGSGAHLRSGDEQDRRFARYPGVVERAAELGLSCAFDLQLVAPQLPPYPCPDGLSEMAYLRRLVDENGVSRYGPRHDEWLQGAWDQLDRELDLIEHLGFPGYFLVVWDIVAFCQRADIFCQGRGSAANSAVCYVLGITKADAVSLGLLFERFLSPERDGPPDIDLDIESDRREEVIQYVYERHGRRHAAQVANVITYRSRSAVRDAAKALGYAPGQQDAMSKSVNHWSGLSRQNVGRTNGNEGRKPADGAPASDGSELPDDVAELAARFENLPRHLGIHSGGMVMCDRPVVEVCPVEWARMEGRTVLQWDKDDCAAAGLVKFDLLGLGMLSALHYAVDLMAEYHGETVDLAALAQEDAVYQMLCRADSVGVFQVESRAQMSTLPRLRPRNFYDLVVEVALIRPGPIQGGSVHPYIRRRNGDEPVTYLHPLLENALAKTLGVPLFQEQLMQMAIDVAGFTPSEADQLRQAMGSKRSWERMEQLKARFGDGAAAKGVPPDIVEEIWIKLAAFANYGFPESHSISFAYLVYSSSWIKLHYPAAFCAALLNAQPMGFYSPHSLVQDARRHGVPTVQPCVNQSKGGASLVPTEVVAVESPPIKIDGADDISRERRDHGWAVRLGLRSVRGIGTDLAENIAAGSPYSCIEAVARRNDLSRDQLEALATAGALDCFGAPTEGRRELLWQAGAVAQGRTGQLPGMLTGLEAPALPGMDERELALADMWSTGVAANGHPTAFLRSHLDQMGVVPAVGLKSLEHRSKVWVAGVVTHRQRPATASGVTFFGLEDETGLINVVVSPGCWEFHRKVARGAAALLIRGRVERQGEVVNIAAERLQPLPVGRVSPSRDFR